MSRIALIFRRLVLALLLLVLVYAFVAYVWPTLYRYDHITSGGDTYPVRINRINGDADMLVPDQGWAPVEGDSGSDQHDEQNRKVAVAPVQHRS